VGNLVVDEATLPGEFVIANVMLEPIGQPMSLLQNQEYETETAIAEK
jgi:hypothetical protein